MAKKYSENEIPNLNADWGKDMNDAQQRPYSGQAVQSFIKGQLSGLTSQMAEKGGALGYSGGKLELYDETDGRLLSSVSLDGTVYAINVASSTPTNFYALQSDVVTMVECFPTTKSGTIGGSMNDFIEDYEWELLVDNGSGFVARSSGECQSGKSFSANVRNYLVTGSNRIKFTVTGKESKQTTAKIFNCQLTSLSLTCNYTWQKAWLEGETYGIDNIYFSGNLEKTLYVAIDGDYEHPLTKTFSAGTRYVTSPYTFDLTEHFPNDTGVHTIELWMEGGGIALDKMVWNIMTVKQEDKATAELIVINNVNKVAVNYDDDSSLFEYSTYGVSEARVNITANDGERTYPVVTNGIISNIESEVVNHYPISLEVDSEKQEGFNLTIVLEAGEVRHEVTIPIDNSKSFPASPNAVVYVNPSSRTNNDSNREKIVNLATNTEMDATWSGMSWSKDGWVADENGRKCLRIEAGSTLSVPTFKPFANAQVQSASIEMLVRVQNAADYNSPILTFVEGEYNANSVGVVLFPTQLMVQPSGMFDTKLNQRVNLSENEMLHLVVVLHRNYSSTGRNLCQIYVNGVPNCTFEYGNVSFGNGSLKIHNPSSDINVYLMRSYNKALEYPAVVDNMLNCISSLYGKSRSQIRLENDITDNGEISYDLCKAIGLNVVVWEQDTPLVSLENQTATTCNLRIEYAEHPEWNVKVDGIAEDGQGTTSMKYPKWNVRHNNKKELTWLYGWNQQTKTYVSSEVGKAGYLDGGLHPKVAKITFKKNVASSTQGHKMGATGFYNDLMKKVVGSDNLANEDARYAVYQYPFVGFVMRSDGTYEFVGLYTGGPDKTDKKTFGYGDDTMMIEGPNHAPLMTRFLVPWTDEVWYDATKKEETLKFGTEEGWDADIVGQYSSDNAEHQAAILTMYATHFKPLYDLIYFTSPYLASFSEAGVTAASLATTAGAAAFRESGTTNGRKNDLLSLYDTSYNLYYYHVDEKVYKKFEGHNVKTYLGSYLTATNPTTADILAARVMKFKAEIGSLMNMDEAKFHKAFCLMIGATDNDAKNTYWRLVFGKLWGFNQDDLDSILPFDNNGNDTKSYSIEPQDLTEKGNEIFQGSSSAFWTRVWESYQDELGVMMKRMLNGMLELAEDYGITAPTIHETIMNVFDYYFWSHSAKYFPATCYNEDAIFAYIGVWQKNPTALYNGVAPLTQALGDQYQSERLWVERRIAYLCSKYTIAGFEGSNADGWGTIECTLAKNHTFSLTPAIDLYPAASLGGATAKRGDRTMAGEVCTLQADTDSSGSTTFYLKGLDWLEDVGDLSTVELTTRGGSDDSAIRFSVNGKRLRRLKIGDVNGNVKFNAQTVGIIGDCIEEIDARNVTTLSGALNLKDCPRLKRAYFGGTNISEFMLPEGGKVEHVEMPDNLSMLFLSNLPLLNDDDLVVDNLANIEFFYFRNTPNVNGIELLRAIYNTPNNKLHFVTAYLGELDCDAAVIDMIADFIAHPFEGGEGYGRAEYNGSSLSPSASAPIIEGKINVNGNVNGESLELIRENYPNLEITYTGKILTPIHFADPEVKRICVENWGGATGGTTGVEGIAGEMTKEQAAKVGTITEQFYNNALITSFDEFKYFENAKLPTEPHCFANCSSLESITFPPHFCDGGTLGFAYGNVTSKNRSLFYHCENLKKVDFNGCKPNALGSCLFEGCSSLSYLNIPTSVTILGNNTFHGCSSLKIIDGLANVTELHNSTFSKCGVETLIFEKDIVAKRDFNGSNLDVFRESGLKSIEFKGNFIAEAVNGSISRAFYSCESLETVKAKRIVFGSGQNTFYSSSKLVKIDVDTIEVNYNVSNMFNYCSSLVELPNIEAGGATVVANMLDNMSSLKKIGSIVLGDTSSLTFPTSLEHIGNVSFVGGTSCSCFNGCSNLVSVGGVSLADTITDTSNMFKGCSSITDWSFLEGCDFSGVTKSDSMFYGCTGLNNVNNVPKRIGTNCFRNCTNLKKIDLSKVEYIGDDAFNGCDSLVGPILLLGLIDMSGNQFSYPFSHTNVSALFMPNIVSARERFGEYNRKLELLDYGSKMTSIGLYTSNNYGGIIVCRAITPPMVSGTQGHTYISKVFVPSDSVSNYKIATTWSDLSSKIFSIGGEEWVAEFGSDFEYADYIKYGVTPPTND